MAFPKTHLADEEGGQPYCNNPRANFIWAIPQNHVEQFLDGLKIDRGNYCHRCVARVNHPVNRNGLIAGEILRRRC